MNETSSDEDTEDERNEEGAAANPVATNVVEKVGAINLSAELLEIVVDPLDDVNDSVAALEIEKADESNVTGQLFEIKTDSLNGDAAFAHDHHDEESAEQNNDDSVIFVSESTADGATENESLAELHIEPVGHLVKNEDEPLDGRAAVNNEQEDAALWGFFEYFEDVDEPNSA